MENATHLSLSSSKIEAWGNSGSWVEVGTIPFGKITKQNGDLSRIILFWSGLDFWLDNPTKRLLPRLFDCSVDPWLRVKSFNPRQTLILILLKITSFVDRFLSDFPSHNSWVIFVNKLFRRHRSRNFQRKSQHCACEFENWRLGNSSALENILRFPFWKNNNNKNTDSLPWFFIGRRWGKRDDRKD